MKNSNTCFDPITLLSRFVQLASLEEHKPRQCTR